MMVAGAVRSELHHFSCITKLTGYPEEVNKIMNVWPCVEALEIKPGRDMPIKRVGNDV